ncbi:MAG TPA: TolC family protein [Puia sp.]|nr:TolC family protein [Puia sp.]
MQKKTHVIILLSFLMAANARGQVLTLKEAVQKSLANYGTLKAKANYVNASKALVKESSREYLPDLNISAQQDYGTINSQNGPLYGYRGLGSAASGPVLSTQSWNAAFGALYLTNINWDFFAFGRAKEKVRVARSVESLNTNDLEQEKFRQEVRVAAAYLNLLAAQRISRSQKNNLERALALQLVVSTRAKNGLTAGVDSSLANAEVSNAKIDLTTATDYEQQQAVALAQSMGITAPNFGFLLDTLFIEQVPKGIYDTFSGKQQDHPVLKYYQSRIAVSDQQARYYHTLNFPTFTLFALYQGRGSGFDYNYGILNPDGFSHGYWSGVDPTRSNYLVGLGVTWNLTNPLRVSQLEAAQKLNSRGLQDEYDLANQDLVNQLVLSDSKIRNAMANYAEAPTQVKAATDAYTQKTVMYKNGLSTIVDVTQALYTLNRAETDRDVAYSNVWQALLLKAAAVGDFGIFINQF